MIDEIPQWAKDRVEDEVKKTTDLVVYRHSLYIDDVANAFARYIMQHEKPPVDKDVLAVRAILASQYDDVQPTYHGYLDGAFDGEPHFQDALTEYRKHKQ